MVNLERLKLLTKKLEIQEKEFCEEFVFLLERVDVIERILGIEVNEE